MHLQPQDILLCPGEFVERELKPLAAHTDESAEFPWAAVRKGIGLGVLGHRLGGGRLRARRVQGLGQECRTPERCLPVARKASAAQAQKG